MFNQSVSSAVIILASTALAACGGSSGSDASVTGSADTTPTAISDDATSNPDSGDNASNAESGDTTSAADSEERTEPGETSEDDSTTSIDTVVSEQSSSGSSDSVCGSVENSFSYDVIADSLSGQEFGLGVSSPVTGYGWDGSNFCDMDNSIGVTSIAVLIPEVEFAPDIDGITDFQDPEWAAAAGMGIRNNTTDENITSNLLEANVPGYSDGARPGEWFATHDNENLYLRYVVRNEFNSSDNIQVFRDSSDAQDDDSIDIYIDGDNSKATSYDGVDDFHVTVAILDDSSQSQNGPNSAGSLELTFGSTITESRRSLSWYEVQIDLESAGIVVGRPFGFEIQLNEDDNGGARDAKYGWFEPTGSVVADSNPSVFGTVLLTGCANQSNNPEFCGTNQLLNPALQ